MSARQIVIIGGTQAGPTAAARARELDDNAQITIIQRGAHLSFGFTGLHHHVSGEVPSLSALDQEDAAFFARSYGVEARLRTEATQIDLDARTVTVRRDDVEDVLPFDSLIYAVGAANLDVDGVVGENVFSLRSFVDVKRVVAARKAGASRAVVIGGGSFGLEAADGLIRAGFDVTLVERRPQLLSRFGAQTSSLLLASLKKQCRVITGHAVVGADVEDGRVHELFLDDGQRLATDIVVVCAGVHPRAELLQHAGIPLREDGTIAVDDHARVVGADGSIVAGVFACGASVSVVDVISGQHRWWAQAAITDKVAQVAGENAAGGDGCCGPFTGTMVVRAGAISIGRVGLSTAEAIAVFGADDVDTSLVPGRSHDSWFPASQPLLVELVSRRSDGRVVGGEACGAVVDKRLDVLATAIVGGLTVEQLSQLDLSSAAAFNQPRDVLNTAALLAVAERAGRGRSITPTQLRARSDWQIVDVRGGGDDPGLAGAVRIPLSALRQRLDELDPARPTVVHCGRGRSGWLAMRVLQQHGFADVSNLAGGLSALRREES